MAMVELSTALLLAFAALGAVDAFYIHLFRLRLYAHAESWREHLWHTVRALLFPPILLSVFLAPTTGLILWIGGALLVLDQLAEVLDVADERKSRARFGGVGRGELALHVVLLIVRAGAILFALWSRPDGAWALDALAPLEGHPAWVETVIKNLLPGAYLGAAVHVWLAWRHRPELRCCGARLARGGAGG